MMRIAAIETLAAAPLRQIGAGLLPCARSGQSQCYNQAGRPIPCPGSGQDATFPNGAAWPVPRFVARDDSFIDRLTGLEWWRDADASEFPLNWREALDFVARANRMAWGGHSDWLLPNRRELRSLIDHGRRCPALPEALPARGVFQSWY